MTVSDFGLSRAEIHWLSSLAGFRVPHIGLERTGGWLVATVAQDEGAASTYSRHEGTGRFERDRGEDTPRLLTDDGEPADVG